jgi:hypothetical protein
MYVYRVSEYMRRRSRDLQVSVIKVFILENIFLIQKSFIYYERCDELFTMCAIDATSSFRTLWH